MASARRKKSSAKERDILAPIKIWLAWHQKMGLLKFQRVHVGPIFVSKGFGTKFVPNEDMAGTWDLWVLANGKWGIIETKREGEYLTPDQTDFGLDCLRHGAKLLVARNPQIAIEFVEEVLLDRVIQKPRSRPFTHSWDSLASAELRKGLSSSRYKEKRGKWKRGKR